MAEYLIQDTTLAAIGDAIRAKEESSAPIPVSDIAARIAAIETGVTVQRKAGSFTANVTNGGKTLEATVNCGFVPDVVLLKGKAYTEENTTYYYDMAAVFSERSADKNYLVSGTNNSYTVLEGRINQTANGFKITFWGYDDAWGEKTMVAERMEYVAIKYT